MFDGLKLSSRTPTPAKEAPARAEQGLTHDFRRAVERASRSAEAVLQARASGGPVLEHQKDALERATEALRSEEHTSELQSLMRISYAVFCLEKKKCQKNSMNAYRQERSYL